MNSSNKFVVYTVFTGNTESELNDPFPPDTSIYYDRICFTDDMSINPKSWRLVSLDSLYLDAARASKLPKILPHHYLSEYEWSLYIDNTVRLKRSPMELFLKYADDNKNYWCPRHPSRDCIYDEAEEVIRLGYDEERRVREQMDFYRKAGHLEKSGLTANTVLLRKHNASEITKFNEIWFNHILRFSKRDQLSFSFLAKKLGLNFYLFDHDLKENDFWIWPGFSTKRLPRGFNEDIYTWLNPAVSASDQSPAQHYLQEGAAKALTYSTRRWELTRLANKYKTDKGNYYYNGHNYATVYEYYFQSIRHLPLRILEIGLLRHDVQARTPGPYHEAPSLQMWREYFPNAEIIGFDIQDFSAVAPMPNVKIIRGDMEKASDLLAIVENGKFDIIIDDASHASHHQQIALSILFLYLNENGFYIIEDLDSQPPALERSDAIKTQHLLKLLKMSVLVHSPYIPYSKLADIYANSIINFYDSFGVSFSRTSDSLVVIQKITKPNNMFGKYRLGRGIRLILYLMRSYWNKVIIDLRKYL